VYGPVRTVVWQGSAGNRCPYADQIAKSLNERLCLLTGQSVPVFIQVAGSFLISARILMRRLESLRSRLRSLPNGSDRRNISMAC